MIGSPFSVWWKRGNRRSREGSMKPIGAEVFPTWQGITMTTAKKSGATKAAGTPKSMPKAGKDPKGGLTEEGRKFFAETEGSHLKPGVKGKADTPEKQMRKGSFLRRHYANPRGPVVDDKGEPTRQALQAAAWGEPVPKTEADEKKLADKGKELLEEYHAAKGDGKTGEKAPAKKVSAKKTADVKVAVKKAPARKSAAKKA